MKINFGKLRGKSVALAIVRHQDYVAWILQQPSPTGQMKAVAAEAKRLIQKFDAMAIQETCCKCRNRPATRFSVYRGNFQPQWWCDTCDPYSQGAAPGRLTVGNTYQAALHHVTVCNAGRRQDYKDLLKAIAEAKGLPSRVGEKQAAAFFK